MLCGAQPSGVSCPCACASRAPHNSEGHITAQASSCRLSPDGIEWDQTSRPWERVPCHIPTETLPRETASLAAAIQPLEEEAMDRSLKAAQGAAVVGHSEVVEVSTHFTPDRVPEVGEFPRVALLAKPAIELHQRATESLLRGFALQPCFPCPAPAPVMGKAEKVKGWQTPACPECLPGVAFATGQQARLLGVEAQPEFPQPQREAPAETAGRRPRAQRRASASSAYRRRTQ